MERSDSPGDDRELWHDFVLYGRTESFHALVQRYKLPLFNAAYRILYDTHAAEDVVQRVFVTLIKRKNQLANVGSLRCWLYRATFNQALNMKKLSRRRKDRERAAETPSTPQTPRDTAGRAELREELDRALAKLKHSLRIPLILRYLQGMSHAETSETLGLSSEATRKRISRALKRLRKLLTGRGLLLSFLAVEEGLKAIPAKAASADFLSSTSSLLSAASVGAAAGEAAVTSTAVITGVTIMTVKAKIAIGAAIAIAAALLFLCFRAALTRTKTAPSRPVTVSKDVERAVLKSPTLPPPPVETEAEPLIDRPRGVAIIASSEMVEQRPVDFSNTVNAVWDCNLGTVFAAGDSAEKVEVPPRLEVNPLKLALSRCSICLLLWDEKIHQNVLQELQKYLRTGGWLVFVSCPWTATEPKSSPGELLHIRDYRGVADLRGLSVYMERESALALLKHPSVPDLPLGKKLTLYRPSYKSLAGGEVGSIPLVRFENPSLRGVCIQSVARGGIIDLNWDCPAGGRIEDTEGPEFLRKSLRWLAAKDTWKDPTEHPAISLKVIARTPDGEPAPGTRIALNIYTDWAKRVSQTILIADENGECEIPTTAPAIYTAEAADKNYSSDTLAFARIADGTAPEPLVVTVRPVLRIAGTVVYGDEVEKPAVGVDAHLLPSSRACGMEPRSCVTDDEGRFSFQQVPAGRSYLLRCETQDCGALTEIDLPRSAETGTFEANLTLRKLAVIDGKVVEEGTEQTPIEGATVRAEPFWGIKGVGLFVEDLRKEAADTDVEGRFSLQAVPDLTYRIRAEAPGYVWPWTAIRLKGGRRSRRLRP